MSYDNTNTGILARNERKEKENHPDLQGSINVDGKEYWLSAWSKRGRSGKLEGKPFFSLSVKPKEERQERREDRPKVSYDPTKGHDQFEDDDIPF